MQFILMDLIGPFDPCSNGYHYAMMLICMLTGYTSCIPLNTKTASRFVQAYIDEIYAKFGGSRTSCLTMGQNLKINSLPTQLPNWVWNIKFIPLLAVLNPMEELKDSIISSKHACLNMYQNLLSGTK